MAEDEEKQEGQQEPDDSEEKFWARFDERSEAALDRWAAKLSAEIDEEEEKKPADKVKVAFEARKKAPKPEETKEDGPTERMEEEPEPTAAERSREAGRRGPGRPSGYWERVKRYF